MPKPQSIKHDYQNAAKKPHSAQECGMEEAFDMGYIQGPRPDLPERSEKPESEFRSRSDVPGGCP